MLKLKPWISLCCAYIGICFYRNWCFVYMLCKSAVKAGTKWLLFTYANVFLWMKTGLNTPVICTYCSKLQWSVIGFKMMCRWRDTPLGAPVMIHSSNAYAYSSPIRVLSLTHCGRDKMDAISQTPFSNAFSWMKMHEFCLRINWSLLLKFELTILRQWFR